MALALAITAPAAQAEEPAGPRPPAISGSGGPAGTLTVSGGGHKGDIATASFSPNSYVKSWVWYHDEGDVIEGCTDSAPTCKVRINGSFNGYRYDPATDEYTVSGSGGGWERFTVEADTQQYDRDWYEYLFGPSTCTTEPAVAPPAAAHYEAVDWSLDAEVSQSDGLVLKNVKLGERYLAARMSLPYYTFAAGGPAVRGELTPNGNQAIGRSRLINFTASTNEGSLYLAASYDVDKLPGDACMRVVQEYQFAKAVEGDHCEPTGKVPCARFFPTATYWVYHQPAEAFEVSLPQRLEFVDDAAAFNAAALTGDQNSPDPVGAASAVLDGVPVLSAPIIARQANPVIDELGAKVIADGASVGDWDNYHQTDLQQVELPRFFAPDKVFAGEPFTQWAAVPGCPECVHMHWRWTPLSALAPGFADANGGAARVPHGSTQDVTIGLVHVPGDGAAADAEADPQAWRDLVNFEPLGGMENAPHEPPRSGQKARIAFWYEGTGRQDRDTFLGHGGFFGVDWKGIPVIDIAKLDPSTFAVGPTPSPLHRAKSAAKGTTIKLKLSEWGEALFRVQRKVPGVKVKGKCRKGKPRKGRKRCTRVQILDEFAAEGGTDAIPVPFSGRIGKKPLKPGRYQLSIRARDLSGTLSKKPKTIKFRIVRAGR
ncbi:MAG: hypothetical protein QOG63_1855 [Thermoleophilaceae bacterium]|nr:hypothetical protein [Thermoleophilaceae bacterium]